MKNTLKTIAGAAVIGATFAANAAAEDLHADFGSLPNSTLFASAECIEEALRDTFGQHSSVYNEVEYGLITAQNVIDGKPVLAEVYLGVEEAVASLNVTIIDGTGTITAKDGQTLELQAAPQGTGSLFYRGDEGVSEFSLQGYDKEPLAKYIETLDKKIRACAGPGPFVS